MSDSEVLQKTVKFHEDLRDELEDEIAHLRQERHDLANRVQVAEATRDEYRQALQEMQAERDQARAAGLEEALEAATNAMSADFCEECKGRGESAMLEAIRAALKGDS